MSIPLAPSWSHGSKLARLENVVRPDDRWLPRGAMDLNLTETVVTGQNIGWLPRGAMDLNL